MAEARAAATKIVGGQVAYAGPRVKGIVEFLSQLGVKSNLTLQTGRRLQYRLIKDVCFNDLGHYSHVLGFRSLSGI
jgi:hypothetical protein